MLSELRVKDFAIIDDLQLRFHPGFSVLTGETGAGKSIIIDAIELLLGTRASRDVVRGGAEIASIEGLFELHGETGQRIHARLAEEGLEGDGILLILAREVRLGGRSVARINGRAVAQSLLAEVGGQLVDIHGQGQHLSLLNSRAHIYLLDAYAELEASRGELAQRVVGLRQVRAELDGLRRDGRELARRIDLLSYQADEIDAASLVTGEDETLESERRRLANAEILASQSAAIYRLLGDGDSEMPSALDQVSEVTGRLEKISRVDPDLVSLQEQAAEALDRLSDLARALSDYNESIAFDPDRLAEVEERLELIFQLKRKYGDTIAEILAYGKEARAELGRLAGSETRTSELEAEETQLLHVIGERSAQLSTERRSASSSLAEAIEGELADLRMGGTRFQVEIEHHPDPDGCFVSDRRLAFDATGIDRVQFLVSANPGEPLRPLARVASGGETARLMLALKEVLSRADATPTLIFDEIDQGIGGRVGAIVGRKLAALAHDHQVLCVTHLAQIAAYGDCHLAVQKLVEGDRMVTRIHTLVGAQRVQELAAMLGTFTEAGRQSAEDLLDEVEQYRQTPAAGPQL